jgi:hypothetical protein
MEITKTKANNVPHITLAPRYTPYGIFVLWFFWIKYSRAASRGDICKRALIVTSE